MLEGDLKNYKKRLETAINAALLDSPHISQAIQEFRDRGLDVFLIVEATIGFKRQDDSLDQPEASTLKSAELELTTQDAKFLRKYGIRPD